jgi:KH/beta-lactamase-domain protein
MDILKEILKIVPNSERLISDAGFEGANIVLYTKDKTFFLDNNGIIRSAVNEFKKRIELRCDPSITLDMEKAEAIIKQVLPEEAKPDNIIFDPQRAQVIIETEKPGVAIGKQGALLREIKEKTCWTPLIKRTPAIRSKLIENVRGVLYQNSDYRRKFLDKVGHRIYDGWMRGKKEEWIRVSQLGAGRQVGRSCIFLQTPESRILLDCGIDPADSDNQFPYLEAPEFNINDLDAVIVSHAHLDHSGLVPWLYKMGYRGAVYCTAPTRDVMSLLAIDFHKIMKNDRKEPLYEIDDIREMVKHSIILEYEEVTDVTPDVRITFYNSGHVLGGAMVHLHIGNGLYNFLYTGDMKFGRTLLLDPAVTRFPRLEAMMLESTYGGKENEVPTREESETALANIIKETIANKGKVLFPVLGVGRSQEIMLIIEQLMREGLIEKVPVFVDGMVWDITAIHTAYPEFMSRTVRTSVFQKDENPFLSGIFRQVGSPKERQQVLEETGACIILATSGMLVGGPSVEYLKQLMDNPKNTLCFTCYQADGSLGRRIQRGEKEIGFGSGQKQEVNPLKMRVETLEGFTGHSSRKQLIGFVAKCEPRPRKIIVNHGESSRCLDLSSSIHKLFKIETAAPRNLETVRLR